MKKLIIVGVGETACLAYEYFTNDSDYEVCAFAVSKDFLNGDSFNGLPLVALEDADKYYPPNAYEAFVAVGSGELNRVRTKLYDYVKSIGYVLASYISTKAFVWHNVEIGDNCFILEDNTLQPFTKVGNNVTMWSGNHLGHRSIIEDNCFITSHVVISGFCRVGKNTFMGVNSSVADNVTIGKDNFIGMCSIINKNTLDNQLYASESTKVSKITAKRFCRVKE